MKKLLMTGALALVGVVLPASSVAFGGGIAGASTSGHARASAPRRIYEQPLIGGHTGIGNISTSSNWSGYADIDTTFSSLSGSWVEPKATCAAGESNKYGPPAAAFWVGIDGYSSGTVEQTGTDSDCTAAGKPHYYAWYEMFPAYSVSLPAKTDPVTPGNVINASVVSNAGDTSFTLTISDTTKGWTFTKTFTPKTAPQRTSAEWIAESPETSGILPLADFGKVTFTKAMTTSTASPTEKSISGFTDSEIELKNGGKIEATPSALSSGGSAFSITWSNL